MLESVGIVACFDDVAVMGDAVEQCGGHLEIAKDLPPFAEGEIGGDDQAGLLVEAADEVEEQSAAGFGKRQVTEFINDHGIHLSQMPCHGPGTVLCLLPFQAIDQIDSVVKADAFTLMNGGDAQKWFPKSGQSVK